MTACLDHRQTRPGGGDAHQPPLPHDRRGMERVWTRCWHVAHRGLATLGLLMLLGAAALVAQPEWRAHVERHALGWLQSRQAEVPIAAEVLPEDPAALERVVAADLQDLPVEQVRVATWLARKYRVASEPVAALVAEAHRIGPALKLDPALLLAVMAIESRFNPFAASPVGAHGLMQVMTRVHEDKFENFGGSLAAFDPVSNLHVGARVLQDAVRNAGSVAGGLRLYVGAVSTDASDYIVKVLTEHERLKRVAQGQRIGFDAPVAVPAEMLPPAPTPPQLEAEAGPPAVEAPPQAS